MHGWKRKQVVAPWFKKSKFKALNINQENGAQIQKGDTCIIYDEEVPNTTKEAQNIQENDAKNNSKN